MDDKRLLADAVPRPDVISPASSGGDPKRARRWLLVRMVAWVAVVVLVFFLDAAQDILWLAALLLAGTAGAFALALWASNRQRHYSPTPSIIGLELGRYKAAVRKPGATNERQIWLVLSEGGIYLLGRGMEVHNQVLRYSDFCCAQRFDGNSRTSMFRLFRYDDRSCILVTRQANVDPIVGVLGAHDILIHTDSDVSFFRRKSSDTTEHQACRTRSPQRLTDPVQRDEDRYWDGWTNYRGHVRDEEIEIIVDGQLGRPFKVLEPIRARVTPGAPWNKARTVDDVNSKLREVAFERGANAIIDVQYERRLSATFRKVLTGRGIAVSAPPATRECPHCAETIDRAATVCRFCGRDMPEPPEVRVMDSGSSDQELEWMEALQARRYPGNIIREAIETLKHLPGEQPRQPDTWLDEFCRRRRAGARIERLIERLPRD